ncbi:MAG: phosphoribosylaminoimidazolesuccinocarboxamide synthase [Candidatus Lernaella stagnicola]|nr:phosphoribosylaminoimidazolesuccinocarboxamide synthase [Candidatus Lernaella stagnicola]
MTQVGRYKIIYAGSVKNLRSRVRPTRTRPGVFLFEYTDDYSIFDYGKMPDTIPGKGATAAVSSAYFFERVASAAAWRRMAESDVWKSVRNKALRDELLGSKALRRLKKSGMPTHYRGIVDVDGKTVSLDKLKTPSNVIEVHAVNIVHPRPTFFGGRRIWNYNHIHDEMSNFLVPLECVFRFGLPEGSSLLRRLASRPDYHLELGLSKAPKAGSMLSRPIVEYFSKLEPSDRLLDAELALNVSGLRNDDFLVLSHYTMLLALFLRWEFAKAQVKLWDGKFEFVHIDDLALGDAITPDELRLTLRGVQLSKEPIRQYYRKYEPGFVDAMGRAVAIAQKVDKSLAKIVNDDLKKAPPKMNAEFHAAVRDMYIGLTEAVCQTGLFGSAPSLTDVMKTFKKFGVA